MKTYDGVPKGTPLQTEGSGLKIMPWLVLPFMTTVRGEGNRK